MISLGGGAQKSLHRPLLSRTEIAKRKPRLLVQPGLRKRVVEHPGFYLMKQDLKVRFLSEPATSKSRRAECRLCKHCGLELAAGCRNDGGNAVADEFGVWHGLKALDVAGSGHVVDEPHSAAGQHGGEGMVGAQAGEAQGGVLAHGFLQRGRLVVGAVRGR